MFAINHAATALIFRKRFPQIKLIWLLLSVQIVEFMWVALNLFGFEKTTTENTIKYIGDIHLQFMPYSHSILSSVILSIIIFLIVRIITRSSKIAIGISLALLSHIVLDLAVHAKDIAFSPLQNEVKYGSELYVILPYLAFIIELGYGIFCWLYYAGSKQLLLVIVGFNLANFTMFSPDVVGLEGLFVNKSMLLTLLILVQIIATIYFLRKYSDGKERSKNKIFRANILKA